jgi:hypothetical protein
MPFTIRKIRNVDGYKVVNTVTGRVHARCTTREKAESQVRILNEERKKEKHL